MKKISNIIKFAFLILLFSCQKNFEIETLPTTTLNLNENDSIYITKYLEISPNTIYDTLNNVTFLYDNLKRVTTIYDTIHNLSSGDTKHFFYYNNNDSLPFKRLVIKKSRSINIGSLSDTTTSYFTYNMLGKLVKDSSVNYFLYISYQIPPSPQHNGTSKTIINYTYNSNEIYSNSLKTNLYSSLGYNYSPINKRDTATIDLNNNVIKERNGIYYSTITYDNKPSPISKLNIKSIYNIPINTDYVQGITEFKASNNNLLTINQNRYSDSYLFFEDYTGFYQYRPNGLPSKMIFNSLPNPLLNDRNDFFYTPL